MQPAVRMVCEIDLALIVRYPLETLPWKPAANGVCGMLEEFPGFHDFLEIVEPHFLNSHFGFHALSKVIPGQVIKVHTDRHDGECKTRVHIPLLTNADSYFYSKGEFHHMQVGYAYVIDPNEEHGVVNFGTTDRIHLIFNMVH